MQLMLLDSANTTHDVSLIQKQRTTTAQCIWLENNESASLGGYFKSKVHRAHSTLKAQMPHTINQYDST